MKDSRPERDRERMLREEITRIAKYELPAGPWWTVEPGDEGIRHFVEYEGYRYFREVTEEVVAEKLRLAKNLLAAGQADVAADRFRHIFENYPNAQAAAEAWSHFRDLTADPEVLAEMAADTLRRGKELLKKAEHDGPAYRYADRARHHFSYIVEKLPDTKAAEEARKLLEGMQ